MINKEPLKMLSEDSQEMPQLCSTAFPRYQTKRDEEQTDFTNAIYGITDAQTKKNFNRGTALELKFVQMIMLLHVR